MGLESPVAKQAGTQIHAAGASEAGRVRAINQDSYFVGEIPAQGFLAVVADGMGGHQTGEIASQKAVSIIRRELERAKSHPPGAIAKAVQTANLEIYNYAAENPEHFGMGTTLTTLFIDDQVGLLGHIGDSRAYLVRNGEIRQLSQDHSWVADRVRQGLLSEGEAKRHRWRNVITNALGASPEIKLDILHMQLQVGDRLLLCSDGISMLLRDETLLHVISEKSPGEACAELIRLANERGSPDNITAIVLHVAELAHKNKNYALPPDAQELKSVHISATQSGIHAVEEVFPRQDFFSKLHRHPLYPYRFWLLGSLVLTLLFLLFSLG